MLQYCFMKTLLVLAAGMGSRFGGLKQLEPVGPAGEVLLDYSVYDALRAGFDRLVFVIRRDFEEEFREKIGSRYESRVPVEYAFQDLADLPGGLEVPEGRTKPWGTGHAIWSARTEIDGAFLTVNADDFYGPGAYMTMSQFLQTAESDEAALVAYRLDRTLSENGSVARGVCQAGADGFLTSVEECTEIRRTGLGMEGIGSDGSPRQFSGRERVSMNFWGFGPGIFGALEDLFGRFLDAGGLQNPKSEFYIPTAVTDLVKEARLKVAFHQTEESWFGVTYRDDRDAVAKELESRVREGLYPASLEAKL
jgi:hypothetical protein